MTATPRAILSQLNPVRVVAPVLDCCVIAFATIAALHSDNLSYVRGLSGHYLFHYLGDDSRTYGPSTFANGEAHLLFDRHWAH